MCRLVGVRLKVEGEVAKGRPVLLVANHTSWLDIPVLSAVAPVSFVAKKEVSRWPFVSALARLQRSVFVDRERRSAVGASTSEILARLNAGDAIVLFAEGTSSDGNRVLPFKSSLFAAAKPPDRLAPEPSEAVVQTLSIVYMRLCGYRSAAATARGSAGMEVWSCKARLGAAESRPARCRGADRPAGVPRLLRRPQRACPPYRGRGARQRHPPLAAAAAPREAGGCRPAERRRRVGPPLRCERSMKWV